MATGDYSKPLLIKLDVDAVFEAFIKKAKSPQEFEIMINKIVTIIRKGKRKKNSRPGAYFWYQIKTSTNKTGWIYGYFLKKARGANGNN